MPMEYRCTIAGRGVAFSFVLYSLAHNEQPTTFNRFCVWWQCWFTFSNDDHQHVTSILDHMNSFVEENLNDESSKLLLLASYLRPRNNSLRGQEQRQSGVWSIRTRSVMNWGMGAMTDSEACGKELFHPLHLLPTKFPIFFSDFRERIFSWVSVQFHRLFSLQKNEYDIPSFLFDHAKQLCFRWWLKRNNLLALFHRMSEMGKTSKFLFGTKIPNFRSMRLPFHSNLYTVFMN